MDGSADNYSRYLAGDDSAFIEIIREYKDGLILFLNGFTHNLSTAEDLMEDTFVKIVTKRPVYRPNASFKAWLYAIARNVARDWCRKQKYTTVGLDELTADVKAADSLEQQYLQDEQRLQLYSSLKKINPDYAQVLYLSYFEDFNNRQIAVVMKKSTRQIENLLYRAKLALKTALKKEGFVYEELS